MTKMRLSILAGFLAVCFIATAVYFSRPNPFKTAKHISLRPSSDHSVSLPLQREKLRIAVGAIISPAESLAFYQDMFDYVGMKLGCGIEMVQRKTYAEVNFMIQQGQIDAAFVCSRPYVAGHRDFGLELLCVPVCFGKAEYHSYFIVHKDSAIEGLGGLRDKLFAFSDPLSNTGMLIPTYVLAKMGETPETFFKASIFTYSHDNSIRSVADRFVDGAAVDSLIWEYMNAKGREYTAHTRIIHKSAPCAIPPLVVSPSIDRELREELRSAFLEMHNDVKGREILKQVLIERFTVIEDSAYDSIREMEDFMADFRSHESGK